MVSIIRYKNVYLRFHCSRVFPACFCRVSCFSDQHYDGFPQLSVFLRRLFAPLSGVFCSAATSFSLFHRGFRPFVFHCASLRVGCSPSLCAFVKSDTRPAADAFAHAGSQTPTRRICALPDKELRRHALRNGGGGAGRP